jgi:hypothetical protein
MNVIRNMLFTNEYFFTPGLSFLYLLKYKMFELEFWRVIVCLSHLHKCLVSKKIETSKCIVFKVVTIAPSSWYPLHYVFSPATCLQIVIKTVFFLIFRCTILSLPSVA